jgi:hypothetical protein
MFKNNLHDSSKLSKYLKIKITVLESKRNIDITEIDNDMNSEILAN